MSPLAEMFPLASILPVTWIEPLIDCRVILLILLPYKLPVKSILVWQEPGTLSTSDPNI